MTKRYSVRFQKNAGIFSPKTLFFDFLLKVMRARKLVDSLSKKPFFVNAKYKILNQKELTNFLNIKKMDNVS